MPGHRGHCCVMAVHRTLPRTLARARPPLAVTLFCFVDSDCPTPSCARKRDLLLSSGGATSPWRSLQGVGWGLCCHRCQSVNSGTVGSLSCCHRSRMRAGRLGPRLAAPHTTPVRAVPRPACCPCVAPPGPCAVISPSEPVPPPLTCPPVSLTSFGVPEIGSLCLPPAAEGTDDLCGVGVQ